MNVDHDAPAPLARVYSDAELKVLRERPSNKALFDHEFDAMLEMAQRLGADLMRGQLLFIVRHVSEKIINKENNKEEWIKVRVVTPQCSIDFMRIVSTRGGKLAGIDPVQFEWFDPDQQTRPKVARVCGWKLDATGTPRAYHGEAWWSEYNPDNKMWQNRPRGQLAKCAEALMHRKLEPFDLAGVYAFEEMDREAYLNAEPAAPAQTVRSVPEMQPGSEPAPIGGEPATPAAEPTPAAPPAEKPKRTAKPNAATKPAAAATKPEPAETKPEPVAKPAAAAPASTATADAAKAARLELVRTVVEWTGAAPDAQTQVCREIKDILYPNVQMTTEQCLDLAAKIRKWMERGIEFVAFLDTKGACVNETADGSPPVTDDIPF